MGKFKSDIYSINEYTNKVNSLSKRINKEGYIYIVNTKEQNITIVQIYYK